VNTKNKVLLSSLISFAVLSLTACGGGDSTPVAQHPDPDFFSPIIKLNGEKNVVIEEGATYIDAGATASDNVDLDNVKVTTSGFVNANTAGTYTMTYSATDVAGNEAEETRSIKVIRGTNFSDFDNQWVIDCQATDPANTELTAKGVTYLNQTMTISKRDIKLRARGFNEGSCSGTPVLKGTAEGRIVYTGEIISSSYTGEKVDVELNNAHFSGPDNQIFELSEDAINSFVKIMGLPTYDILAKANDDVLLTGVRTTVRDGSSNDKRPVEFNSQETFYKN